MDVAGLRDRIQATLDPNAAIRQQAELDLKYVRALMHPTAAAH
jgi:importin-7